MPPEHHHTEPTHTDLDITNTESTPSNPLLNSDHDEDPPDDTILSSENKYHDYDEVEPPEDSCHTDDGSAEAETSTTENNSSDLTYTSPFINRFSERQQQILADLNDIEINSLLKKHLASPIAPIPQSHHEKIQHLFVCPLLNPDGNAGLTAEAEQIAQQSGLFDLLELSRTHKETTRIHIHAILKTCELFIKHHEGDTLDPKETQALHNGIVLEIQNDQTSTIKTFDPQSNQLTAFSKTAIATLYNQLHPSHTNHRNILLKTSAIQKALEHPGPQIHTEPTAPQPTTDFSI
jgi:hypothetical protein